MIPSVTIVIPVFNNQSGLTKCIESIINGSELPDEIIIIDDGSYNPPKYNHPLVLIYSIKNAGPANARNVGASLSKSEYIFFTDSDCWLHADAMKNTKIAIREGFKNIAGPYGLTKNSNLIAKYSDIDLSSRYQNIIGPNVYVHGTYNLTIKKSDFQLINGFDVNFPRPSGEDFDLVLRISEKFGPLKFINSIVVFTEHEKKIKGYLKKQYYRGYDRVYYYIKNKKRLKFPDYYTLPTDFFDLLIFPILICGILVSNLFFLYFILNLLLFYFYKIYKFKKYKINSLEFIKLYLFNAFRFVSIFLGLVMGLSMRVLK